MGASANIQAREIRYSSALVTIVGIGVVAGTLDITDNLIFNHLRGITPAMVFRYIAAGLIGARAAELGAAALALGAVLHYCIAISWTAIFYVASRRLRWLSLRPIVGGILYGALVYLFMNLVVVPLSNVPHVHSTITLANRVNGVLAVVVCIGMTISLLVRWSDTKTRSHS